MYIPKKRPGMFGNVGRYEPAPGTIEEMPRQPAIDEAPGLGMRGAPMQDDGRPHGLRRVAGIVADALAGAAGRPGPYAAMLHERQQQAAELAAEQRKRSLERDDYIWKQEYEAAHPKAANNDTLNDMAAAASWTPEQWAIYDKLHPVYRVGPDGIPYPMARGGSVPTAPVGKLTPIGGGPQVPPAGNFP